MASANVLGRDGADCQMGRRGSCAGSLSDLSQARTRKVTRVELPAMLRALQLLAVDRKGPTGPRLRSPSANPHAGCLIPEFLESLASEETGRIDEQTADFFESCG